jgi:SHS2 domain-containing protein
MPQPSNTPAAWHELREHTGEVVLRVGAPSLGGLFVEAARGLAELSLDRQHATASGSPRMVALAAQDPAALLVDWLNELIYLAETERWVALEFEQVEVTGTTLRIQARGATLDRAPSLIKAATLHGLQLGRRNGGLQVDVVLDV